MGKYTHVTCKPEARNKLVRLVVEKYGKLRCVMGDEVTKAILKHCEVLEKELEEM